MSIISRSRLSIAIAIPAAIFLACIAITFSAKFQQHPQPLSLAITLDLILTAPLAYYLIIRKTSVPAFTVARVLLLGIMLAGLLLSKSNTYLLNIIKTWISPLIEVALITYLGWKFYRATKTVGKNNSAELDFLMHCRIILRSVLGSQKLANILASEIAVFYYLFAGKAEGIDYKKNFTCYRENGIVLVLSVFLSLFVIETIGMHFILQLWSKTAAWILSGLGLYTCLQLFAHIKSLMARPIVITDDSIILRHGIMGGDAIVALNNIDKIVETTKLIHGEEVVKMALIKGLEKHQLAIYLKAPVTITKAFGIQKTARIILVTVDKHRHFLEALTSSIQ